MDKWKAIRRNIATGNKEIELFDLTLDSKEKNDVSKSNLDVISQIEIIFKEARTTPTLKNFYIKGLDF
jgi:arylsulfatase